jgi:hypothetical protein
MPPNHYDSRLVIAFQQFNRASHFQDEIKIQKVKVALPIKGEKGNGVFYLYGYKIF